MGASTKPIGAGLRSLVVPGWGQVVTHPRRLGWVLVGASMVLAGGAAALVVVLGPMEVIARLADPSALLVLLAVNLVVAAARLASTGHAWWSNGGRNVVVGVMLAGLVLIPHVAVAWVGTEARHTLLVVFAPPEAPPPPAASSTTSSSSTTTTSSSTTTTTTTSTTMLLAPIRDFPPESPPFVPPTTPTTLPPFPNGRLNLLLLGGDAGPGRSGLRTDTIMVASVDTISGEAALFGLPRNYAGFTFSDGTPFGGEILNEVYGWGRRHPDAYGGIDPGASAIRDVAENLTGLAIDHFLLVDLTGFADVVDAFGGVRLEVPVAVDGPLYDTEAGTHEMIRIPAGHQTLNGDEALAYARARHTTTDYVRMGRQRCLLAAMVSDIDPVGLITRLPVLLEVVENNATTDIGVDIVPHLIRLAGRVSADEIRVVGFDHSTQRGRTASGHPIPDVDTIRRVVHDTITDPAAGAGAPTTGETCG